MAKKKTASQEPEVTKEEAKEVQIIITESPTGITVSNN